MMAFCPGDKSSTATMQSTVEFAVVMQAAVHRTTHCCCSVLHISNKCLEEDVPVFKYSIQDIVDELEVTCDDNLQAVLQGMFCLYAIQ